STTLLLTTPVPSLSSTPPLPTSTLFPYTTLFRSGPLLNRFGRHRVQAYELTADDARLYREYTGWLAQRNMLDFDDLVTHAATLIDRKSTRLNSSHGSISYAVFCLKKKKQIVARPT